MEKPILTRNSSPNKKYKQMLQLKFLQNVHLLKHIHSLQGKKDHLHQHIRAKVNKFHKKNKKKEFNQPSLSNHKPFILGVNPKYY